jgi:GMP synthase (glutamine-hydrolysing)
MLQSDVGTIAIVDFGGQYAHLIARRIRDLGVFCTIHQPDAFLPGAVANLRGIILSGGPRSVTEADAHCLGFHPDTVAVPVLGICYGHQLLAALMGGRVSSGACREYGMATVSCRVGSVLFAGLEPEQQVWMSHGDHVDRLPNNFRVTASSRDVQVAAYEAEDRPLFGLQFHPEVTHTTHGLAVLDNFLSQCMATRDWNPSSMAERIIAKTRLEAGDSTLFLLVSGGVDSLVALQVCITAIGADRVICLHVDTGLMRQDESVAIMSHLADQGFENLHIVEAESQFLRQLGELTEPEAKRLAIGRTFVDVLKQWMKPFGKGERWKLVQGTIYPDTIESGGSRNAAKIKTHHNRVEEIEELIREGRVVEPLIDLYKDEVRTLGGQLGLPDHLLNRHPFPGPGLGIRVLCSDGAKTDVSGLSRQLDSLLPDGISGEVLPIRSVGVQGDFRTYSHPAAIWMTKGDRSSWSQLKTVAAQLVNSVEDVNRVVLSPTPLNGRFALRPTLVTKARLDLLRTVDAMVRELTEDIEEIWQAPVVSLPLYDVQGDPIFVARPVCSLDAMTADVFEMPWELFHEMTEAAAAIPGAACLLYDLTSKPPGTIEWE